MTCLKSLRPEASFSPVFYWESQKYPGEVWMGTGHFSSEIKRLDGSCGLGWAPTWGSRVQAEL